MTCVTYDVTRDDTRALTECRHAVDDVQIFEVLLELVLLMFGLVASAIEQQRLFDQRTVVLGKNKQPSDKSTVHTHTRTCSSRIATFL